MPTQPRSSSILDGVREFLASPIDSYQDFVKKGHIALFGPELSASLDQTDPFKVKPTQAAEALNVPQFTGPPEPEDPLHPANLRALLIGVGDVAKAALTEPPKLAAQALQIFSPQVIDLRQTPLLNIFPELVEKPEGLFEIDGATPAPLSVLSRGAQALGLLDLWEKQTAKENRDMLSDKSFIRKAIGVIGELTFSPILDVAFNLGIDSDRTTPSQRYHALPLALLQATAVGSGAFGLARGVLRAGGMSTKAPKVPLAEIVKNNERRLMSLKDIGGEAPEPLFSIGDSVLTTEGLAEIIGEKAKTFDVQAGGKTFSITKTAARRAANPGDNLGFDIEKAWEVMGKQADLDHLANQPRQPLANALLDELVSGENAPLSPARAGALASELLSHQEINQLGVAKAYTTTLRRALDPKQYALSLIKDTPELSIESAMKIAEGRIDKVLTAIDSTATEAGMNLKVFSDMKELIESQRRLSPDAAERLAQLNKDAAIGGWMDRYRAYIDGPMRSSMTATIQNLTRNSATQFARGLVNAVEHSMSDSVVALVESLKGKNLLEGDVNPKFLRPDKTIDYSRIFADTMSDIMVLQREGSDIIDAAKAFAYDNATGGELRKYSNDTVRALVRGEDPPLAPAFFTGRFSEWEAVKKLYPKEFDELLNSPSGEIPVSALYNPILKARMINSFKALVDKTPEVRPNWTAANQFFDEAIPSAIQYATSKMGALSGMNEIWQRRLFATARMEAWARREGKSLGEFLQDGAQAVKVAEGETSRPQVFDKALWDSVGYANSSTWANRRFGKGVQGVLDTFNSYPALHQLVTPFPPYFFNRMAFLSEHMPTKILGMLNKDFYKKIAGEVIEADVVLDLKRDFYSVKKNRNKEFKPPDPDKLAEMMPAIRADAQREAANAASKALVGMSAVALGSYVVHSELSGSRWNLMRHPTETDENGRPLEFDIRPWDAFALPIGLAKAIDAVAQGQKLTDAFSTDDMMELITGIRRVDDTALAVFDLPELMNSGEPEVVFTDFVAKFAGSNVGKMFVFFRNARELAGLSDFRAFPFEGRDELVVSNQRMDPLLGPALANLPKGLQRSLLGTPIPGLNSPFKSGHLRNQYPIYSWATGANLRSKTPFEDLIDTTDLTVTDAVGRQPSQEMKQMVAGELGRFFDTEVSRNKLGQPVTLGDSYTENILRMEADLRRNGINVTSEFREEQLRKIFAEGRAAVEPLVIQMIVSSKDESLIMRTLGRDAFNKLSGFEKSLIRESLESR